MEPGPLGEGEQARGVGEDGEGAPLGGRAQRREIGPAHRLLGQVRVHVRVLEEAERELLAQQAAHGRVDPGLGDAARADQLHDDLGALLAAELVAAGLQGAGRPLGRAQVLQAPGAGRVRLPEDRGVVEQAPVGAHDAVEAELLPEQAGDHALVEAEADLLPVRADRLAVVRHHLRASGGDGRLERLQVVLAHAARVDLLLAVREVRVLAVLLRAAAGEVLDHRGDRAGPERGALQAAYVGAYELGGQAGVGAEGAGLAGPAGLGRQVDLGVQGDAEADGEVLAADGVGEPVDEPGVADGGQAQGFGPGGEGAGVEGGADVVGEGVARVGGQGDRDAQAGGGGHLLDGVLPAGHLAGAVGAQQVEVGEEAVLDQLGRGEGQHRAVGLGHRGAVRVHHQHGVEELAGLLLQRHPGEQVLHAPVDGQRGVLVGGRCVHGGSWTT